jgi:acyl-CoA synthetase (AMP-forming)/AMP-acid ligase II
VRLFVGNGMRPGVWQELLERFGPLRVLEFYGSTEGNVALANLTGTKIGAVGTDMGRGSRIELVEYDVARDDFKRDAENRLITCSVDTPGVLIAKIDASHPMGNFDGYTKHRDTEAKILHNAFEPGDAWFVTGDMLRRDADGDFYFVDRIGDTFRWKGENVSTEQVNEVMTQAPFIKCSTVYGVALPMREGRAGMAAIELIEGAEFDGEHLYDLFDSNLFKAALPRFIRIVDRLETTTTLKLIKHKLQQEGADPSKVSDEMYYFREDERSYEPLDDEIWARLTSD